MAIILNTLVAPLSLLTGRAQYQQSLTTSLAPALILQLKLIYSSAADESSSYNLPMLLMIHLISPIASLAVSGAAWVAVSYWLFAAIIGDPDGNDSKRGENDGRDTVLAVRKWWEMWLCRGLRP